MVRPTVAALLAVLAACSDKQESAPPPQPAPVATVPADAAVDGITDIPAWDPSSGTHLDDGPAGRPAPIRPKHRDARPIEVVLKSTPSGAIAAVDGVQYGPTPAYWFGEADGREHEFTFVMPGHAVARYRFLPVSSGTVHARLERITETVGGDGGLQPILSPSHPADAAVTVEPPPTVLTPDAGVPKVVPPPASDVPPVAPLDAAADPLPPESSGPQP